MRSLRVWLACCGVLAGNLAICGPIVAQEQPAATLPPELRNCAGIARNTERLACFDRAVAALLKGDAAAAPSAESIFGLVASTPAPDTARGETSDEVMTVTGKISALNSASDGDAVITLDNGQVWRQLSGGQLLLKVGDEVRISRAALGSFQMKVPSGRSGKVRRLR